MTSRYAHIFTVNVKAPGWPSWRHVGDRERSRACNINCLSTIRASRANFNGFAMRRECSAGSHLPLRRSRGANSVNCASVKTTGSAEASGDDADIMGECLAIKLSFVTCRMNC